MRRFTPAPRAGVAAAALPLLAILLLVVVAWSRGVEPPLASQDRRLQTLAERLEAAVNAGDPVSAEALTGRGVRNDYTWIREWRQSGGGVAAWRAGLLSLPGARASGDEVLLHVSRPQVCQSTSDRLYRVQVDAAGARLGREMPETEMIGARVTDHAIRVSFNRSGGSVAIEDSAALMRQPSSLPFAVVRMNQYFRVSGLQVDGKEAPHSQSGGFVAIPPLSSGTAVLSLRYSARLKSTGESFIAPDEAALTAYWYPHTGRVPATSQIMLRAPAGWRSIGPGERVRETRGESEWVSEWRNPVPVSYITVAAGRYRETAREAGDVRVAAWLLDWSQERADTICRTAADAIAWFSKAFARYPYSSFTVVESRLFPPALEGYSFTLAGSGALPAVIPHEISHTWWGGLVPNAYTRSMWNEAFATYSEWIYDRLSRDERRDPGEGAYSSGMTLPRLPALGDARDAMHPGHSSIGYQKGALVLAQVERMIGSDAMLRCMRQFVADHRRGESAEWGDFAAALARVAGSEWSECLNAWLRRPDLPTLQLRDVAAVRTSEGAYEVRGEIAPSAAGYWMRAPVVVLTEPGPRRAEVLLKGQAASFRVRTSERPVAVEVDPEGLVLRGGPKVIRRLVTVK